jgi:hypothetical protein
MYNSPLAGIPYFSRLAKKRKGLKWQNFAIMIYNGPELSVVDKINFIRWVSISCINMGKLSIETILIAQAKTKGY